MKRSDRGGNIEYGNIEKCNIEIRSHVCKVVLLYFITTLLVRLQITKIRNQVKTKFVKIGSRCQLINILFTPFLYDDILHCLYES